jgi:hypothetical protein
MQEAYFSLVSLFIFVFFVPMALVRDVVDVLL